MAALAASNRVQPQDEIPGLGPKTDRPRLNTAIELANQNLTPIEGFILSRVDGRMSYDEICMMSGLDREQTLQILRTLKQARLILAPGEVALGVTRKRTGHTPPVLPAMPEVEAERYPETTSRPAPVTVEGPAVKPATSKAPVVGLLERLDDGAPVAASELVDWPDAASDLKARIVRLHRRLKQVTAFDLLGVGPDADSATLRRAFAMASKELHPDRYFGKNLGSFKTKLAAIFSRLSEAVQEIEQGRKSKQVPKV
jgi:hypothetical protein